MIMMLMMIRKLFFFLFILIFSTVLQAKELPEGFPECYKNDVNKTDFCPLEAKLDGTSLFPLLSGRKIPENPIYLHTMPHEDLTDDDAVGVRTSQFKYFRHARNSGKNIHLFDLKNDPLLATSAR